MWKLIEKVRGKSDAEKKAIAFGISGSVTGVIFIIWLSVTLSATPGEVSKEKASIFSPLNNIKAGVASGISGVKKQFRDIKSQAEKGGSGGGSEIEPSQDWFLDEGSKWPDEWKQEGKESEESIDYSYEINGGGSE